MVLVEARFFILALFCALAAMALDASPAWSACVPNGTTVPNGSIVNCTGTDTTGVGNGNQNNVTVTVQAGATISAAPAVSLNTNNSVTNNGTITTSGNSAIFLDGGGNLVINNGLIKVGQSDTAISSNGTNNNFINNGTITGAAFSGAYFAGGGNNTEINNGVISLSGFQSLAFFLQGGSATNNGIVTLGPGGVGFDVFFGANNLFTNNGIIATGADGISLRARNVGSADITNSGTLDGLILLQGAGGNLVTNGGLITITAQGTPLAAGNYTIQGLFSQTAAGTLGVRINNAGAADSLVVSGGASLGGTVLVTPQQFGHYNATNYNIVNAGALSGVFAGFTFAAPFAYTGSVHLAYDSNDAFLDLGPGFVVLATPAGANQNQRNVVSGIDNFITGGGTLSPPFVSLAGLSPSALLNGLTQLDGEAATGGERGAFQLMNQFLGLMLDPFVDGRGANAGIGGGAMRLTVEAQANLPPDIALAYAQVLKAPPPQNFDQRWSVWGTTYGGSNSTSGTAAIGSNNVTAATWGFASGIDYRLTPNTIVGLALAGGGTNWNLAQGLGGGRSDAFQAGVYGISRAGPAYLSEALAFSNHWFSTNRTALGDQLTAGFTGQDYGARIEGGYRYAALPTLGITPYAALQAQNFRTPSYTETDLAGGGIGLDYTAMNATDIRTEIGSRFDAPTLLSGTPLILYGRLAWAHDFVGNPALSAAFEALPGSSFTVNGAPIPRNSALVSAGAELIISSHLSLLARFNGEFAANSQTYAGTGTLRYVW
jgi:uncharacterized protein YhjY with autotransporter beta-barrel domain